MGFLIGHNPLLKIPAPLAQPIQIWGSLRALVPEYRVVRSNSAHCTEEMPAVIPKYRGPLRMASKDTGRERLDHECVIRAVNVALGDTKVAHGDGRAGVVEHLTDHFDLDPRGVHYPAPSLTH